MRLDPPLLNGTEPFLQCPACACPAGMHAVGWCRKPGRCAQVHVLLPSRVAAGIGLGLPGPTVVLFEVFLFSLPPRYVSTAAMAQIRREYPRWVQQASGNRADLVAPHTLVELLIGWADAAVVNAGAHYDVLPRSLFTATVRWLGDLLAQDTAIHPAKRHAWQNTFPSHWIDSSGQPMYAKYAVCTPAMMRATAPAHWSNAAAAAVLGNGTAFVRAPPAMAVSGTMHSLTRNDRGDRDECAGVGAAGVGALAGRFVWA